MSTPEHLTRGNSALKSIISYTYPELYTGKEWYVGFYAFDPVRNEMRRKKIKINFVKRASDRRRYGEALKRRVALQLETGWNPWIDVEKGKAYAEFSEVLSHYRKYIEKLFADEIYREDTYVSYLSYARILQDWNSDRKAPASYIYQFDETFCADFLEYVYVKRDNSARTRDNYLGWLKSFSSFLLQHRYIKTNPTEGLKTLSKSSKKKQREILQEREVVKLQEYLIEHNKHFLLASYLLYYCFIRPKEMSLLRISSFSISGQTVFIPDTTSKNHKNGTITLPSKVIKLMNEIGIFSHPGNHFLFSDRFMPGVDYRDSKQFRDYWTNHVRKDLKFSKTLKFYSLKDTGITNMLRTIGSLSVRDQARHSTLLMTDIYTPHDLQEADEYIKNHNGLF